MWAELKTLTFAAGIPNKAPQEASRVVVPQLRTVRQCTNKSRLTPLELNPFRCKQVTMHPRTRRFSQPRFEILEQFGKAFEHRIWAAGYAIFPILVRETALHVETRATTGSTVNSAGKNSVDFTRVRFSRL